MANWEAIDFKSTSVFCVARFGLHIENSSCAGSDSLVWGGVESYFAS
jgi:hypothetical protein